MVRKFGSLGEVGSLDAAGTEMKEAAEICAGMIPVKPALMGIWPRRLWPMPFPRWRARWLVWLPAWWISLLRGRWLASVSGSCRRYRKAKPGQGEPLKDEQDELNERAKELLEKIDQAARALGDFNENATEDLLKGARDSREDGLSAPAREPQLPSVRSFPQAKRGDKVAGNLEKLEEELKGWPTSSGIWKLALRDLVEKSAETQQKCPGCKRAKSRKPEELAKALGDCRTAESDERLLNLTRALEQVPIMEDSSQAKSLASAAVAEALELVEQFFWQEAVEIVFEGTRKQPLLPVDTKGRSKNIFEELRRVNKDGVRLALISGVVGFWSPCFCFALFFTDGACLRQPFPGCLETDRIESLGRRSFLLLVRPYLETMSLRQTNLDACLADLSGSMGVRDERGGLKRIEQVSPHLDGEIPIHG